MKNIKIIPIDNRPICYNIIEDILSVNKNLKYELPKKELLGGLNFDANCDELIKWLDDSFEFDVLILSFDTLIYGGLISSRRLVDNKGIKARLDKLKEILIKKKKNKNLKIYAHSSIMRISNNNINEEEKEYWNLWGKKIYDYSYNFHKAKRLNFKIDTKNDIPEEILEDYLNTRKRNFEINKTYLNWLKEGILDYLIFSKDDTGEFGINVYEAEILESYAKKYNLPCFMKTGADEIPLLLLLRGITDEIDIKIKIEYKNKDASSKISRYEDITVEQSAKDCIFSGLKNGKIVDNGEDVFLFLNNFDKIQGELVFLENINSSKTNKEFSENTIIADINNANGADNGFVDFILNKKKKFLSYSGYNTTANSIGSSLAIGIVSYLAKKEGKLDELSFKKNAAIRLLDDWAYQANIRKFIQEEGVLSFEKNKEKFKYFENKIKKYLNIDFRAKYRLPWNRSFEIEIELDEVKNGN